MVAGGEKTPAQEPAHLPTLFFSPLVSSFLPSLLLASFVFSYLSFQPGIRAWQICGNHQLLLLWSGGV